MIGALLLPPTGFTNSSRLFGRLNSVCHEERQREREGERVKRGKINCQNNCWIWLIVLYSNRFDWFSLCIADGLIRTRRGRKRVRGFKVHWKLFESERPAWLTLNFSQKEPDSNANNLEKEKLIWKVLSTRYVGLITLQEGPGLQDRLFSCSINQILFAAFAAERFSIWGSPNALFACLTILVSTSHWFERFIEIFKFSWTFSERSKNCLSCHESTARGFLEMFNKKKFKFKIRSPAALQKHLETASKSN